MNFGVTSLAAPNAASSRTARYSSTARPAAAGGRPAAPSTRFRSLASAWIRLASTANPSPPTRPSWMQRCRTVSNSRRSRSLSRKRPCRFFERVEWSGTGPSSPIRQPTVGQVQMNLFAQPPLGADAKAIADDQQADQQFGGRGLSFERLARFGDQARVFHCDDRLRREVL